MKHRTRPCDLLLRLFLKLKRGVIENYFGRDVFREYSRKEINESNLSPRK